jgi:hypothetical protein
MLLPENSATARMFWEIGTYPYNVLHVNPQLHFVSAPSLKDLASDPNANESLAKKRVNFPRADSWGMSVRMSDPVCGRKRAFCIVDT